MPCNDGGGYDRRDNSENNQLARDELASFLCGLCFRLEKNGQSYLIDYDPSLKIWWSSHKKQDELRRTKEAADKLRQDIKNNALSKLTPEEREALGLR